MPVFSFLKNFYKTTTENMASSIEKKFLEKYDNLDGGTNPTKVKVYKKVWGVTNEDAYTET